MIDRRRSAPSLPPMHDAPAWLADVAGVLLLLALAASFALAFAWVTGGTP